MIKILILTFFITNLLLTSSCHFLSKKQAEKTEEVSNRSIAAINPNPPLKINSSKPVSTVVLFRDKKPVCSFSAVKHHRAIPSYFEVTSGNNDFRLPECNQKDMNTALYISQKTVFLDENRRGY